MISIDVSVRSAPYKIYLGENILPQLAQELKKIHPSSALIVTNTTVGPLYGEKVRKSATKGFVPNTSNYPMAKPLKIGIQFLWC